jgi:hypothetical protein
MKVLVLLAALVIISGCTATQETTQTTTQETTSTTTQTITQPNDTGATGPVEHGTDIIINNETGDIYRGGRIYSDNLFFSSCQVLGNNDCKLDDFTVRTDGGDISFFNDLCIEFGFETPRSCADACGCNQ